MSTCIVCGKEVHIDDGYATDGKIFVCRHCAETETLRTVTVHISNAGVESALVYKREAPIDMAAESGLVNQTDDKPHVELDKSYIDERDGSPIPNGCSKDCPYYPYDTCGHYYGELHECMLEEEEIEADIENMSPEDFISKYADNPTAIAEYMDKHPEECNTY